MRHLLNGKILFFLVIWVWCELALSPMFLIRDIRPDFFLLFLAFYAFHVDWKHVLTFAFLLGLVKDLTGGSFFGLETAAHVSGSVFLKFIAMRFDRDKRWTQLTGLFAFAWLTLLIYLVGNWIVGTPYVLDRTSLAKSFWIAVYTTAFGAVLFPLMIRWWNPVFGKQYELF